MTASNRVDEVRRWLRYARDDLLAAEQIVSQETAAPRIACYLAQQAAEKTLKAALLYASLTPIHTHDLSALRDALPIGWLVTMQHPDLRVLTEWAVRARYPGDLPDATERDAELTVRQARAIWESIAGDLYDRGFDIAAELS